MLVGGLICSSRGAQKTGCLNRTISNRFQGGHTQIERWSPTWKQPKEGPEIWQSNGCTTVYVVLMVQSTYPCQKEIRPFCVSLPTTGHVGFPPTSTTLLQVRTMQYGWRVWVWGGGEEKSSRLPNILTEKKQEEEDVRTRPDISPSLTRYKHDNLLTTF